MTPNAPSPQWVIDPNNPAELVRRLRWDRLLNRVVGLFPPSLDLSPVYRILEIGSGAGEWTLEAARSFPVCYVGIDSCPSQIAYATSMARMVGYDDLVRFQQADLSEPLPFADGSFDLVHVRFLLGKVPTSQWHGLLREVWRVLTTTGTLLLSEAEWPTSNSPALEQFTGLLAQALRKAGYRFSPDGHPFELAEGLPAPLQQHGWHSCGQLTHVLPFSAGSPLHEELTTLLWTTAQLMPPFLMRIGETSQPEVEVLAEQMVQQRCDPSFVGTMSVRQTWMHKGES